MEKSAKAASPSSTHGTRAELPQILPKGPSLVASNDIYQRFKEAEAKFKSIAKEAVPRPVTPTEPTLKPIAKEVVVPRPSTPTEPKPKFIPIAPKPPTNGEATVKSAADETVSKPATRAEGRLKFIDQTQRIISKFAPKAEGEVKSAAETSVPRPATRAETKAKSAVEETVSKAESKVNTTIAKEDKPSPATTAEATQAEVIEREAEIKPGTEEDIPQPLTKTEETTAEVHVKSEDLAEEAECKPASPAEAELEPAINTDETAASEDSVSNSVLDTDKSLTEFEILTEVKEEPLDNDVDVTSEAEEAEVDPESVLDQIFDAAESGNSEQFSELLFSKKDKTAADSVKPSRSKKRPRSEITEEHSKLVEQLVSVRKSTRKRKIPARCENEEIWETPRTAAKSKRRSVDFKNVKNTVKEAAAPAATESPLELIDYSVLTSALTKTLKENLSGGENDVRIVIFRNNKPIQSFSLKNNINEVAGKIEETSFENGTVPSLKGDSPKKPNTTNNNLEKPASTIIPKKPDSTNNNLEKSASLNKPKIPDSTNESAEKKSKLSTVEDITLEEEYVTTPSPLKNIRGFKKLSTSVKKNNTFLRIKGSYVSDIKTNKPLTPESPADADSDEEGDRLVINTDTGTNDSDKHPDKHPDSPPAQQHADPPKQVDDQVNEHAEPRKPFRVYIPPLNQPHSQASFGNKTTGEFPFKCELCDKEFNLRRTLNRHKLRVHTRLTPTVGDPDNSQYTVSILSNVPSTGNVPSTIADQVEGSGEALTASAEAGQDGEGANSVGTDHDYIGKNQGGSETPATTDQPTGAAPTRRISPKPGTALLVQQTESGTVQVIGQLGATGPGSAIIGQPLGGGQLGEVGGLPQVVTVKQEPEEQGDCEERTKEELFQDILTKGPLADILQSKNTAHSTKVNTLRNVIKRVENAGVAKGLDLPVDANGEIQPVFVCEHCSKYYRSRKTLKDHFMREHATVLGDEPLYLYIAGNKYQCTVCFKYFHSASELLSHTKTHTGELQSPCNICGKVYSSVHVLRRHIDNVHAEVRPRPFRCQLCDYAASNKWHLKEHHRRHTGEQPFLCPICHKAFSHQGTMNRHCKTVHKFDSSSLSREQLRLQQGLSSLTVPSLQLTGSELTLADLSGPLTDPNLLQSLPLISTTTDKLSSENLAQLFAAQSATDEVGDQSTGGLIDPTTGELVNQSIAEQEAVDQSADPNSQSDSVPEQEGNLPFLDMSIVKTEPVETF